MPIRFLKEKKQFILTTKNTAYAFEILEDRYLVHNYYGKKKSEIDGFKPFGRSYSPNLPQLPMQISPDTMPLECSFFGSGDFRTTALRIAGSDGSTVTDFVYSSYRIRSGRVEPEGLPCARAAESTKTLEVILTDPVGGCILHLYYTVFYEEDIITRYLSVENRSTADVTVEKCMPLSLDLKGSDYHVLSLYGMHMNEIHLQRFPLMHGNFSYGSRRGTSSHHHNPFLAICSPKATEEKGDVYGFNLIYSGSFTDEVETDYENITRVQLGLGSECFAYTLEPGERFDSPEAIMTYSSCGIGKMSRNFHDFIRAHILPPSALQPHPVVLNTWEACFFDIDEEKVVQFAEKAAKHRFDMLVMDDGWFGKRDDDKSSLGDWRPDPKKFKNGLAPFVKRIHEKGIRFGIWIEPEMVNPDSDLYRAHPEWAIHAEGRTPMVSRNQLVLDMANPEVVSHLKQAFSDVFDGVGIDYIKWDMNRSICDFVCPSLPAKRQKEAGYRYMKGVYSLLRWFGEHFPNTVIETCSGGGGRYDLGMMQYGFQIWTSDNTDPYHRTRIQSSALIAYPAATMSCHVAQPYHWGNFADHVKTHADEMRSLDFRFQVAVGGMLGYELNILKTADDYNEEITRQIQAYKEFEDVTRLGDYFNLYSPYHFPYSAYYYASKDRKQLLLSVLQKKDCTQGVTKPLKLKEAIADCVYTEQYSKKTYTGAELRAGITLPLVDALDSGSLLYFKAD